MKTSLLLTLMTVSLLSVAEAKPIFGRMERYLEVKTGKVIEIGSNSIEDDGTASFYDYATGTKRTINISELSKSTREEIAGVKAGERILVTTYAANSNTVTTGRYCEVFHVFENKMAYVGCKTSEVDIIPGYALPERFDFLINNVEQVTAQVDSLDGFSRGETAELRIDSKTAKAGRNMKILAIFTNGEVLVQKAGFNILDTSGVLHKLGAVERIQLSDLNKLD